MRLLTFILLFVVSISSCDAKNNKNIRSKPESEGKKMDSNPQYVITATQGGQVLGRITLETFPNVAPKHAEHFDSLVTSGFYNGTAFHRVIPNFMIQGGDPNTKTSPNDRSTWGMGAPNQPTVPAEFSDLTHKRGILSAARRGDNINSATSQFFIMHADAPHLDKQYSIYGQVLEGMEVVDMIANTPRGPRDDPKETITMTIEKIPAKNTKK